MKTQRYQRYLDLFYSTTKIIHYNNYPEGVSAWSRSIPGVEVGHGSPSLPRHPDHHVGTVHRVEVGAEWSRRVRREATAGFGLSGGSPPDPDPAQCVGLHDDLHLSVLYPPVEHVSAQLHTGELILAPLSFLASELVSLLALFTFKNKALLVLRKLGMKMLFLNNIKSICLTEKSLVAEAHFLLEYFIV